MPRPFRLLICELTALHFDKCLGDGVSNARSGKRPVEPAVDFVERCQRIFDLIARRKAVAFVAHGDFRRALLSS